MAIKNWLIVLATSTAMLFGGPAKAGQCLKDSREVRIDGTNVVKFHDYLCRTTETSSSSIRIRFHRVADNVAAALFSETLIPHLKELFGAYQVHKNSVYEEFQTLNEKFGTTRSLGGSSMQGDSLKLDVYPTLGNSADAKRIWLGAGKIRQLAFWRLEIPVTEAVEHIRDRDTWPPGYNFFYEEVSYPDMDSPIGGTILWRYLTQQDIASYEENLARLNAILGKTDDARKGQIQNLEFVKYLTRGRVPPGFLYVRGQYEGCGGSFTFFTGGREVRLEIAVIENSSDHAIRLDGFTGVLGTGAQLRQSGSVAPATNSPATPFTIPLMLEPGASVVVPLQIYLPPPPIRWDTAKSDSVFAQLQHLPADTVLKAKFSLPDTGSYDDIEIQKTKQSFAAPMTPRLRRFAFGPEFALAGIVVGGERFDLTETTQSFLGLTTAFEGGSCPILYSWDTSGKEWVQHGKVIHEAQTKAKQQTETVRFPGLVTRFRIAEEELELAYLDKVTLSIETRDGHTHLLLPRGLPALHKIDGRYLRLYSADAVDFDFELPDKLDPADVVASALSVTGYYDRYGALLMGLARRSAVR